MTLGKENKKSLTTFEVRLNYKVRLACRSSAKAGQRSACPDLSGLLAGMVMVTLSVRLGEVG